MFFFKKSEKDFMEKWLAKIFSTLFLILRDKIYEHNLHIWPFSRDATGDY
jgi:hypothetical protein